MSQTTEELWEELAALARQRYRERAYDEADKAFLAAVREGLKLGEDDLRLATSLSEWGQLTCERGDFEKAEQMLRRALAIRERRLGPDHQALVHSLTALGVLHYRRGELEAAEPLLARALAIAERELGFDHAELAVPLGNLARLYFRLERHAAAAPLLQRLLALRERACGPEHPEVANVLLALSRARGAEGHHDDAESLARRALAIRAAVLPPDDLALAAALDLVAHHCRARLEREALLDDARRALAPTEPDADVDRLSDGNRRALQEEEHALRARAQEIRARSAGTREPPTLEPSPPPAEPRAAEPPAAAAEPAPSAEAEPVEEAMLPVVRGRPGVGARARGWLGGSWRVKRGWTLAAAALVLALDLWLVLAVRATSATSADARAAARDSVAPSVVEADLPEVREAHGNTTPADTARPAAPLPPPAHAVRPKLPDLAALGVTWRMEHLRARLGRDAALRADSLGRRIDVPPTNFARAPRRLSGTTPDR